MPLAVHHPISYFQAVIMGLLQGVAEPFPISSLGHGVILPRLVHWHIHQNDKFFLTFLIATHLGTARDPESCNHHKHERLDTPSKEPDQTAADDR